jgi:ABC-type multidrug transport system ATPase subunit
MIEIIELTKIYGKVRAVDGLSLTARPGRITGFLGLNGSGKTTTLRMLLGLSRPTSGEALLAGKPYDRLDRPAGWATTGIAAPATTRSGCASGSRWRPRCSASRRS